MARSRLPLRAIAVFETVARLGSFKAAAAALHLTPSAVSHQIRALEDALGVDLFLRESRGVKLAPPGMEYAQRLHGLLDGMQAATEAIAARGVRQGRGGIVRIMTPPSLAAHWLMPRLPTFLDAHPGIDVRVHAIRASEAIRAREDSADEADITIAYGRPAQRNAVARPLLEETYRPYCAPSLLAGAAAIGASALAAMPLIHSRYNDISWHDWFAQRGIDFAPLGGNHLQLDPSYVAIEAAVKGLGVVLESGILTQEHVQSGRLVAPVLEQDRPAVSYWLLGLRADARRSTHIAYAWLLEQSNCQQ